MDSERIAVYYLSSDGGDWALYLQSKLNTKEYSLETALNDLTCDTSLHVQSAKLNLFIVTPDFLDRYKDIGAFFDKFDKRTSLLILTGTEFVDLEKCVKRCACADVLEWLVHAMRGDDESVRELMVMIIGVYEGHIDRYLGTPTIVEPEQGVYDTLPKPRQVNTVRDILQRNDTVYVILDRKPEQEIIIKFPKDEVKPDYLKKAAVFSFNCSDMDSLNFMVLQDGSKLGEGQLERSDCVTYDTVPKKFSTASTQTEKSDCVSDGLDSNSNSEQVSFYLKPPAPHRLSKPIVPPKNIQSTPPLKCNQSTPPLKSNQSKLEIIRTLLDDETDPERLLCQCLGIEKDIKKLDEKMTSLVECAETLKHLSFPAQPDVEHESQDATWPTLLHFGAEFNLIRFCDTLLSNPLMYNCCTIPNNGGLLPHKIAELKGHIQLAEMLKHFLNFVQDAKAGRYDSGFPPESPRLSTISQHIDVDGKYTSPPVPHKTNYVGRPLSQKKNDNSGEEGYIIETDLRKALSPKNHAANLSMLSDRGYSDSIEEESDDSRNSESMLQSPHDSVFSTGSDVFSIPEDGDFVEKPFKNLMDISEYPAYGSIHLPKSRSDTGFGSNEHPHRRKDLSDFLGIQSPPPPCEVLSSSPSDYKKKGFFSKLIRKPRSQSDPAFPKDDFGQYLKKTKVTKYTRAPDAKRSSGTSSNSTSSTLSVEEDDSQSVELRQSNKSKKTYKQILKLDKKRKSLRIKHAMVDANLTGPKLPPRRHQQSEFF